MDWKLYLIEELKVAIASSRNSKGRCSLALTGGKTASIFYRFAATRTDFLKSLENIDFFWGDERCVPHSDNDSNYRLAVDTLFINGVPKGSKLFRMDADALDSVDAANRYSKLLPYKLNVILLTVGEDGHIASIFSDDQAYFEGDKTVVYVKPGLNRLQGRLTITPPVIAEADIVFVLAIGKEKRLLYNQLAINDKFLAPHLPARLVLGRRWIFDSEGFD